MLLTWTPCGAQHRARFRRRIGSTLSVRRRPLLFKENETNTQRVFGVPNRSPYVKDGINNDVVHGDHGAVNPEQRGSKAAVPTLRHRGRNAERQLIELFF
jgi:hypothetical protein